jgi:hypothetical protein
MWFEKLTGFREANVDDVPSQFSLDGEWLTSTANSRTMRVGRFEMVSLDELRRRAANLSKGPGSLRLSEHVANAQSLHVDPASAGATFQVASQFNMLEMTGPSITPEEGIDRYEHDRTQGPACAVACGAGTIYRNYLVPVGDRTGQSSRRQLNGLADLATALGVDVPMRNGYALPSAAQLDQIGARLRTCDEPTRHDLMGLLRIGLQWDTEVTMEATGHVVSQAYCAALPMAYASHPAGRWEPFARLVLEAAYEATLAAAVVNAHVTGNRRVYLTLLGGGAFGNPTPWIVDALGQACVTYATADLDVAVVSYRRANPRLGDLLNSVRS